MSIIYKTTNTCNGKIYIGKDKHNNPSYFGSGLLLLQAIKKYGKENFQKEILEECEDSVVDDREIYWISLLDSTNRNLGYNLTKGGSGGDTTTMHPNKNLIVKDRANKIKEWHQSLSDDEKTARGKKISGSKKGKSNGHQGFTHSEQTKQLIKQNKPKKTDEWKKSHASAMAKRQGKPLVQKYKPVVVNEVEYSSVKHAMIALDIKHRATFYDRIKRGLLIVEYK
jgi:group I intron endonuclease